MNEQLKLKPLKKRLTKIIFANLLVLAITFLYPWISQDVITWDIISKVLLFFAATISFQVLLVYFFDKYLTMERKLLLSFTYSFITLTIGTNFVFADRLMRQIEYPFLPHLMNVLIVSIIISLIDYFSKHWIIRSLVLDSVRLPDVNGELADIKENYK